MIHTFEISYGLSLEDANTCVYRLDELTHTYTENKKGYRLTHFLSVKEKSGQLIFTELIPTGFLTIRLSKFEDHNGEVNFRIYFLIEPEVLRTGTNTLDLYFCSPDHAKELQIQYAKAIYSLFPKCFDGRPASHLYRTNFADPESYTNDEFINFHGGLYSLPYLALASVKRMDFTYDFKFSNPEDTELFTYLVSQSYYDGWKKIEKKGKQKDSSDKAICYDKEYKSKSRGFSVYNKDQKMMRTEYDNLSNIVQIRVDAHNVVRIELPNFKIDRAAIKSFTWLRIPKESLILGPLPYLANEQFSFNAFLKEYGIRIGNGPNLKWFKREKLETRLNNLVKQKKITENAKHFMVKISQAISQGRCKNDSYNLKKAIDAFKEKGKIVLHKRRDKNKNQDPEEFVCNYAQYQRYRIIAIENGVMLVTIPDSKHVSEFSAIPFPTFRNYDISDVSVQIETHMLPYQSISECNAPELEPVKELYDDILSFLYRLYDEYASEHNKKAEFLKVQSDRIAEEIKE